MPTSKELSGYGKQITVVASANVIIALFQFARLPILTKYLGTSLYGSWSLIWSTVTLLTPLILLGLPQSLVRFLAAETKKEEIREGFYSTFFFILLVSVLMIIVTLLFSKSLASFFFKDANQSDVVCVGSLMLLTQALNQISITYFRTFRQMKWYSNLLILKSALEVALMALFMALGWEVKGVIYGVVASDILCILIAGVSIFMQIGFRFPRFSRLKEYVMFGLPLVPGNAIMWFMHSGDRFFIEHYRRPEDVGIYNAAYILGSLLSVFVTPFQTVLLPAVSKTYDNGEIEKTKSLFEYTLKGYLFFSIPVVFGTSALASPLLRVFSGPEFIAGSTSLVIIVIGMLFGGLKQIFVIVFYLVKKTVLVVLLMLAAVLVNIGLCVLLIPRYGIEGAAIATLIAYLVLGFITIVISKKYFNFKLGIMFNTKSILSSSVMYLLICWIGPNSVPSIILVVLAGAAFYVALMLLTRAIKLGELKFLFSILRNR